MVRFIHLKDKRFFFTSSSSSSSLLGFCDSVIKVELRILKTREPSQKKKKKRAHTGDMPRETFLAINCSSQPPPPPPERFFFSFFAILSSSFWGGTLTQHLLRIVEKKNTTKTID